MHITYYFQGNFPLDISKLMCTYARVENEGTIPLRIITWSVSGKQSLRAKEVLLVLSATYLRRSQEEPIVN